MSNTNSSISTGSTLQPEGSVSELRNTPGLTTAGIVFCDKCQSPMKVRRLGKEDHYYDCAACESVRDPFDDEVELAVTAKERTWLDRLFRSTR